MKRLTTTWRAGRGLAVIALGVGLLGSASCGRREALVSKRDVILVVIDTLRSDALSLYGNARSTSPNLDRLARSSVVFDTVFSQAAQTGPSHATLFTGLSPAIHRVSNHVNGAGLVASLPLRLETMAERFQAAGYETVAITDGAILSRQYGFDQGFEQFDARFEGAERKVDRALDMLHARGTERPLFLFLHTYQVHQPYVPPREWAERFDPEYDGPLRELAERVWLQQARARERAPGTDEPIWDTVAIPDLSALSARDVQYLRNLYEAAIAFTDHELERLWADLAATERLDDTLLVITSDHGEEFGEHGHLGHRALHRETVQVPLIIRPPGARRPLAGQRVQTPVASIDIYRTILEGAGVGAAPGTEGIDLLEALRSGGPEARPIFAQTTNHYVDETEWSALHESVRSGRYVRMRERQGARMVGLLYDVVADPDEREPLKLSAETTPIAIELDQSLEQHTIDAQYALRELLGDDPRALRRSDEKLLEELRSLGYVR